MCGLVDVDVPHSDVLRDWLHLLACPFCFCAEAKLSTCDTALDKLAAQIRDLQSSEECTIAVRKLCLDTSSSLSGNSSAQASAAPSALDEGTPAVLIA